MLKKEYIVPQLGHIVRVTKGRERNQHAVIIDIIDDRYVVLADGDKRKYDRPKRKNINHIEITPFISEEVQKSLLETNRVSNGKLRFAIRKYANEEVTYKEKGDGNNV